MADQKISELTLGTPLDTDVIPFVDGGTGTTKKATKASLKGDQGDAATVDVGSTTTGAPGTDAEVTNSGTDSAAILDFVIPRGDKGDKGDDGDQGPAGVSLLEEVPAGAVDGTNVTFTPVNSPLFIVVDGTHKPKVALITDLGGNGFVFTGGNIVLPAAAAPVNYIVSYYNA